MQYVRVFIASLLSQKITETILQTVIGYANFSAFTQLHFMKSLKMMTHPDSDICTGAHTHTPPLGRSERILRNN